MKKVELATYQLKDMAKNRYIYWRGNRPLRGCPVTWYIFKMDFLDLFFPREKRKSKVEEFIKHGQGGRSIHDY